MPTEKVATKKVSKAPHVPKKPVVVPNLLDDCAALHPRVEAAVAAGEHPDIILSGLSRVERALRGLAQAVRQEAVLTRKDQS